MSDINTTLINSVRKIEIDIAEIKQMVHMLQDQFSKQFAPTVSAKDISTMQQNIIEQIHLLALLILWHIISSLVALERVAESVKRSQFTEYPDQLGKQVIGTGGNFKRKNEAQKYNLLLQLLHEQDWKACCKEIPEGQPLPQLVLLSDSNLTMKRLQLKTLSRSIKHNLIDKDFPAFSKEWKGILAKHQEYYMMQLERLAKDNGFTIYKCKSIFKSDNQKQKRRIVEKNNAQQDANNSSLSSDNMSEMDGGKSPIMVDVLSPLAEMSVKPAHKRSQRS
ncbi:hypothetical protein PHYBLDRAFT_71032 [Phycomyces blakesleeanus NRRL 1555(-)]|uniref:Uncharacterized protein n=1 Tax=Phycomyces blakesleeanus (strain ATCC 8743b / DSM 1359 / FGSC 10004 / NBRC 33097 / NRRL 1555) TaxID=763407 RepID=A0A167J6M6_PHYB8|nr:hypothetical protein PHYBLDRAFT_71032 [Phycomyces blakesleeanus NRRL 1555(-)]OAD65298.1 hypothetical protein PHYBLDRAFT_71032 [Phycomyces blakesleeanus NRRL 1555(-)]|eukprot:XP_018283338.1 hypothetical protein PHYBLDRAFT_71032 [Phycomyces blakesleeanus NRRL 1555(-)]